MISAWNKTRNRRIAILHDICLIPMAWFGAFWLRFNFDGIPIQELKLAILAFPVILVTQIMGYWIFRLYRGVWRFASMPDLLRILKAVLVGFSFALLFLFFTTRLEGIPRSVFLIYGMLLIIGLGGSRFFVRWSKEGKKWGKEGTRVLIVGAGKAGEGLVRDLLRQGNRQYSPVAFVDDQLKQQRQEIHGIRVVGTCADIPRVAQEYNIGLIMIAAPSARAVDMRRILSFCENIPCPVHTLPGLSNLVAGRVSVDALRAVSLEDLLGRDPVSLDWEEIREGISEKVVLITGGGGSIGAELCRQIARLNPKALVIVERSEFNLFSIEQEFLTDYPQLKLIPYLLDVGDKVGMEAVFMRHNPALIFHAAAYKHVPLLQDQPREAVQNNVLGTYTLAQLAAVYSVEKFILVSTDKAVNPTNIMGATKRASEIICQAFNGRGCTQFITVRFGNVLGSAGSVVPIFKAQLEKGGPITVTHPEITRFFMTIPEACQLILQALVLGQGGEIFVLDMGEPIKIRFLAEQMIHLAGKKLGEDIEIIYTGLRPGEKLFEELFYPEELLKATAHEKIMQASTMACDIDSLTNILAQTKKAILKCDNAEIISHLKILVPELEYTDERTYA
jgi:FlaA1/EpsC-like NDP-sugar epimerase